MKTTYGYYADEYGGNIIPEQDFKKAKKQAEAYIRHLTYARGDIFVEENEAVNDAVCAVAEVYYKYNAQQQAGTSPVKSENNDGYSVTYVTEQSDGKTAEEVVKKKAYDAAYPYLLPTGWLSRKVAMQCDHKCRCDCL